MEHYGAIFAEFLDRDKLQSKGVLPIVLVGQFMTNSITRYNFIRNNSKIGTFST